MHLFRRFAAQMAIKFATVAMKTADALLDRKRTRPHVSIKAPDPNCVGCSGCPIPGVFWPVEIHGDSTHHWVQRCDDCRRFESDIQAATEIIRLGLSNELGIARPAGSISDSLFVTPISGNRQTEKN